MESIVQVVGHYGLWFVLSLLNVGERLGAVTLRIVRNFVENVKEESVA